MKTKKKLTIFLLVILSTGVGFFQLNPFFIIKNSKLLIELPRPKINAEALFSSASDQINTHEIVVSEFEDNSILEKDREESPSNHLSSWVESPTPSLNQPQINYSAYFTKPLVRDSILPRTINEFEGSVYIEDLNANSIPDYTSIYSIPLDEYGNPLQSDAYFNYNFYDSLWTTRLEAGYAGGRFIGLNENYGEVGVFISRELKKHQELFVDLRIFRLDSGHWAGSSGLGFRVWNNHLSTSFGGNIFYDCQNAHFDNFHRLGVGLEALGSMIDLRTNIYFPIGYSHHAPPQLFNDYVGGYFATCQENEFAYFGVDSEIGWHIFRKGNFSIYGTLGPYYYRPQHHEGFVGGQLSLQMGWKQYITFEMRASHDKKFNTQVQGKIIIAFPFGVSSGSQQKKIITQDVKRNNIAFIDHYCDWSWNW